MNDKQMVIDSMRERRQELLNKIAEYEKELESLAYSINKLSEDINIQYVIEQSKNK